MNLGPLEEQPVLVSTEPSLQSRKSILDEVWSMLGSTLCRLELCSTGIKIIVDKFWVARAM